MSVSPWKPLSCTSNVEHAMIFHVLQILVPDSEPLLCDDLVSQYFLINTSSILNLGQQILFFGLLPHASASNTLLKSTGYYVCP